MILWTVTQSAVTASLNASACLVVLPQVFPALYLPVMEEANLRVLRPYRMYLPTPSWWDFRARIKRLNLFLISYMRTRWEERKAGKARERVDILERIFEGIQVRQLHKVHGA